jgi:hypothetical protein
MRILVTGSRTWDDVRTIRAVLAHIDEMNPGVSITLVSGACPTGADAHAERIAEALGWTVERHPAKWEEHGKRAGFIRNHQMVALGADMVLAFHRDNSRGTQHCINAAHKAGIPVTEYLYVPVRAGSR